MEMRAMPPGMWSWNSALAGNGFACAYRMKAPVSTGGKPGGGRCRRATPFLAGVYLSRQLMRTVSASTGKAIKSRSGCHAGANGKHNNMAEYTIERNAKECRVRLAGELTATTVPALQAALKGELNPQIEELTFDFTNAVMLDSTGICLLIAAYNTMVRGQHRMRVQNVSPDIMQLLQSMRLVQRLSVTGSTNEQENHG